MDVGESGNQPGLAVIQFHMIGHQPMFRAGRQHGALDFSIRLLTGAEAEVGVERTGAENSDIRPIAFQQRNRSATGKQALLHIPFTPQQNKLNIRTRAEVLGNI